MRRKPKDRAQQKVRSQVMNQTAVRQRMTLRPITLQEKPISTSLVITLLTVGKPQGQKDKRRESKVS